MKATKWEAPTFALFFDAYVPATWTPLGPANLSFVPAEEGGTASTVAFRHGGRNAFAGNDRAANVVFLDGHAATLRYRELLSVHPSLENARRMGREDLYRAP